MTRNERNADNGLTWLEMAGMAENGWKWQAVSGNGWKLMDMAGMPGNALKQLEMAVIDENGWNGWRWLKLPEQLEMARTAWKRLKMAGYIRKGQRQLKMAKQIWNWFEWLEMARKWLKMVGMD